MRKENTDDIMESTRPDDIVPLKASHKARGDHHELG